MTVSRCRFSDTAGWSLPPPARPEDELVMLLHGHGGVEQDLTGIFPTLPDGVVGVALRATVPVGDRWTWCHAHRQPLSRTASRTPARSAVLEDAVAFITTRRSSSAETP